MNALSFLEWLTLSIEDLSAFAKWVTAHSAEYIDREVDWDEEYMAWLDLGHPHHLTK